ncbi:MAG: ribosome recycling factor [Saprospiraceae bacterium]|nr:ribosome recycling factor [Saprospiraceae bacterium]
MQEEIDLIIETSEEGMQSSVERLVRELNKIRSGKVSPSLVSDIRVDYYGAATPMNQVANIKAEDGRTLVIAPWEKHMLAVIEQGIFQANIGVTPQNDGKVIRLVIPPLTEERRRNLVKQSGKVIEQAKVSIRSSRREAMEEIKKAVKDGYSEDAGKRSEEQVQQLTNNYIAKVEKIMEAKEKEIMTV